MVPSLETSGNSNSKPVVPSLGSIGSNMWNISSSSCEPVVLLELRTRGSPRTENPWSQDCEALVQFLELGTCGSKIGKHWFQRLGTHGSKIGKHWFERLGTSTSSNSEPVVPRWDAQVSTFGNQQFRVCRNQLEHKTFLKPMYLGSMPV